MVASSDIEMIILDTRALLGLSDTCILAPSMDGIVVVVDITRANEKELKQVKTSVAQIGTCVLGCVVNKQRDSHTGTAYYDAAELRYEKIDTGMGLERDQNGTPGDMESEIEAKASRNGHAADASVTLLPPLSPSTTERSAQSN